MCFPNVLSSTYKSLRLHSCGTYSPVTLTRRSIMWYFLVVKSNLFCFFFFCLLFYLRGRVMLTMNGKMLTAHLFAQLPCTYICLSVCLSVYHFPVCAASFSLCYLQIASCSLLVLFKTLNLVSQFCLCSLCSLSYKVLSIDCASHNLQGHTLWL